MTVASHPGASTPRYIGVKDVTFTPDGRGEVQLIAECKSNQHFSMSNQGRSVKPIFGASGLHVVGTRVVHGQDQATVICDQVTLDSALSLERDCVGRLSWTLVSASLGGEPVRRKSALAMLAQVGRNSREVIFKLLEAPQDAQ